MASQQFIGGAHVEAFEQKMAHYLQTQHVIACNSGTDALWLALKALNIQEHALVLTTPFSFIASSSEIVAHNATPVFIDIDPETFTICPEKLTNWLETNAKLVNGITVHQATGLPVVGIIAVDLFGQCADYTALQPIAQAWKLWLIEDTAQAIGATYQGKQAGTFGTIGCFSFYPTKNLGAFGDAGCCCTNDAHLAERLIRLRNHGRKTHYDYVETGINSRLDGIQAAILNLKLDHLKGWNTRRNEIAARYNAAFANHPLIKIPRAINGYHVYHQYAIQLATPTARTALEAYLAQQDIGTRVFYPKSLQDIAFLNNNHAVTTACPIARNLAATILALPVWPELTDQEVAHVIQTVKDAPLLTPKPRQQQRQPLSL
jgi:dTDP-4-amino-4,6-dideoxygalactose transaminase